MSTQASQVRISKTGAPGDVGSLYLFACQVEWRKRCCHVAGTELLYALALPDGKSCLVAEVLLKTYK